MPPTSRLFRPITTCSRRISRTKCSLNRSKRPLREIGSVGQFAGGMPAMCDGVTQGEPGMELCAAQPRSDRACPPRWRLSHNMFDGALMLGICDKIVPGLMMGALRFGHLPTIFVPGRADGLGHFQQARKPTCASATPKARRLAKSCWNRR